MKRWKKRAGIGLAALFILFLGDYWLYPLYGRPGPRSFDKGANGIWLRYTWYFGEKKPAEIYAVAKQLTAARIRDAYFHVRYIKADGSLRFKFPQRARLLNSRLDEAAPAVRRIAWIFAGNGKHGDVDLSVEAVREKMAKEAAWLVEECGFEGVHWDYEICQDGDKFFLDLLDRTRAKLPIGTFLGVAAPMLYPVAGISWSGSYFGEVAKRSDQIAVMCYDSGVYFPRAYTWLVEQQAEELPKLVSDANPRCEVVLGLPTYEEGPASHNSHAENLRHGLWGVRKGLTVAGAKGFAGVALFADFTTDSYEWQTYRELWSQP